jgi:hypothetical protein
VIISVQDFLLEKDALCLVEIWADPVQFTCAALLRIMAKPALAPGMNPDILLKIAVVTRSAN